MLNRILTKIDVAFVRQNTLREGGMDDSGLRTALIGDMKELFGYIVGYQEAEDIKNKTEE